MGEYSQRTAPGVALRYCIRGFRRFLLPSLQAVEAGDTGGVDFLSV